MMSEADMCEESVSCFKLRTALCTFEVGEVPFNVTRSGLRQLYLWLVPCRLVRWRDLVGPLEKGHLSDVKLDEGVSQFILQKNPKQTRPRFLQYPRKLFQLL